MLGSDDLRFMVTLAGASSLAAAARRLSVTAPAVTQRLAAIEARLGVRLVHRSTRGVTLTDEGLLIAERGAVLLAELAAITEQLTDRRDQVSGHLRVSAPSGFGRRHVAPLLAVLRQAHPDLRVTLGLTDDPVRRRADAWDVIVQIGVLPSSDMQRVPLAPNRRLLCASPAYLARAGRPETPADLKTHTLLAIEENAETGTELRFRRKGHAPINVRLSSPVMACNDGEVILHWALAGLGIIMRSEWSVARDVAEDRLAVVLPDWTLEEAPIVALLSARTGRTARVRYFIDAMRAHLQNERW